MTRLLEQGRGETQQPIKLCGCRRQTTVAQSISEWPKHIIIYWIFHDCSPASNHGGCMEVSTQVYLCTSRNQPALSTQSFTSETKQAINSNESHIASHNGTRRDTYNHSNAHTQSTHSSSSTHYEQQELDDWFWLASKLTKSATFGCCVSFTTLRISSVTASKAWSESLRDERYGRMRMSMVQPTKIEKSELNIRKIEENRTTQCHSNWQSQTPNRPKECGEEHTDVEVVLGWRCEPRIIVRFHVQRNMQWNWRSN